MHNLRRSTHDTVVLLQFMLQSDPKESGGALGDNDIGAGSGFLGGALVWSHLARDSLGRSALAWGGLLRGAVGGSHGGLKQCGCGNV